MPLYVIRFTQFRIQQRWRKRSDRLSVLLGMYLQVIFIVPVNLNTPRWFMFSDTSKSTWHCLFVQVMCVWVHYLFAYVCQKVRRLCESWTMAEPPHSTTGTFLLRGGGRWLDILQILLPLVFSFHFLLLFHLPLYFCTFHPPPLVLLHHLFHLSSSPQRRWIISLWPLLVIWSSHNASCTASHPSRRFCPIRSNFICSHTGGAHFPKNMKAFMERVFLQSTLGAVEDTWAPSPPLPANVGSGETIGGAG